MSTVDELLNRLDPADVEALRARLVESDEAETRDELELADQQGPRSAPVDRSDPNRIVEFTPPDAAEDEQSWDRYWQEVEARRAAEAGAAPTQVIRGVRVVIPTSLPMRFDRDLDRMQNSTDIEDVKAMLVTLFGSDVLDRWVDAGMHEDEFRAALLWGISHAKGKPLTVAEAHRAVLTEGESLRAPANRAERRATPKPNGKRGKRAKR